MSILFVSNSKRDSQYYFDASARYRCVFPAEHFNWLGFTAHVVHISKALTLDLSQYHYLVVHRPQNNRKVRKLLAVAESLSIECIADFDDLLFMPEMSSDAPTVRSGHMDLSEAKRQSNLYKEGLALFSSCWASTEPLRQIIQDSFPNIRVKTVFNRVPDRWAAQADKHSNERRLDTKIIRYLPGTSHHKSDFELINNTISKALIRHKDLRLEIIGDLKIDTQALPLDRISQQKHMFYEQLPSHIAKSWLTIAPLAENEFNSCKSALKFWESGIMGVPVLSSPLPDADRFNNSGLVFCEKEEDWLNAIEFMLVPENYETASSEALNQAQQSRFKPDGDARLNELPKLTPNSCPVERPTIDYKDQQIWMVAHYGFDWPAKRLDPSYSAFASINRMFDNIPVDISIYKEQLEAQTQEHLKTHKMMQNKRRTYRKLRKLYRTPRLFFKDAWKNHTTKA